MCFKKIKENRNGHEYFEICPLPELEERPCRECSENSLCMYYSENNYLINQRVICNREIGKVVKPENDYGSGIWVYLESKGFASCYAPHNVKPLPNGEL